MGVIIRQGLKGSVVTYFGVLIGTINVLFLYNKFLSSEELGLYTAIVSFPLVYAGFINLGVPHIGIRFFNRFSDVERKHNGFFGFILLAPLIGFAIFLMSYFCLKNLFRGIYEENSPLLIKYFWIFPILTFCALYQNILETYSRVHLRIVVPAIIREVFLKLANSFLAILYYFKIIDFDQLVLGIALFNSAAIILLLLYIKYLGRLFLTLDFNFFQKPIFREMLNYGLWTMIGGATAAMLPHIEKMMLPAYNGGLANMAVFGIALNIGLVITVPRNTIASISDPLLAKAWAIGNFKEIQDIYSKSSLNLLILGSLLFLGIWCNIDSIFQIIPNSEVYKSGKIVVLFVGLYSVFDMATGLNSEILKNSPYYRFDFFFFILRFFVLLISNLILIPKYSYNGAAFAMLISVIVYNSIKFIFIKARIGIQPFSFETVKVIGLVIVTFLITNGININTSDKPFFLILELVFKCLFIVLFFGGSIIFLKISTDINSYFEIFMKKLKNVIGFRD